MDNLLSDIFYVQIQKSQNIEFGEIDDGIDTKIIKDHNFSPYHGSNTFVVVATNPSRQSREVLIQLVISYKNFTIEQLNLQGDLHLTDFDHVEPQLFFNSERKQNQNYVQIKSKFEASDNHNVYVIKKVHIPENKREKNPQGLVDKMFASETNFVEVKANQTLKYGEKSL